MSYYLPLLLLLIASASVQAVCFFNATSFLPLSVISSGPSTGVQCKLDCIKRIDCAGLSFVSGRCTLLGAPLSTASCSAPFEYLNRSETGCAQGDVTARYVPDPCFAKATLQPEYVATGAKQICPGLPVEGEAVSRLWIVSVIFNNGSYRSFANDGALELQWDAARSSYVLEFQKASGFDYFNETIYAASCAYFNGDAKNTCDCEPLRVETTALEVYADVLPMSLAPSPACPAGYSTRSYALKNLKITDYAPSTTRLVRCRAGLWIFYSPASANQMNSWELAAGACFR